MQIKSFREQSGVSLIDQMLTTCVAGLLVVLSLPGLEQAKDKRRLDSAVAQIETEMQFARSEAVARGETVRVGFETDAQGSCYVMHTGSSGQCTCRSDGSATCMAGAEVLRNAANPLNGGIRLNSSAADIGFDASRGTVTPTTTMHLENRRGDRVHLVLNIMGRIRSCSPDIGVTGYPAC